MEDFLNFIIDNQKNISINNKINVYIGNYNKDIPNIVNLKMENSKIKNILNKINKNNNFKIRKKISALRVYQYLDICYQVFENHELNNISKINNSFDCIIEDHILKTNCETSTRLDLNLFPSKMEYHNIVNRNIIELLINNLFTINLVYDETPNGNYYMISLVINKQNIYTEKLKNNLRDVVNLIMGELKSTGETR